jgi:hypothetical protein
VQVLGGEATSLVGAWVTKVPLWETSDRDHVIPIGVDKSSNATGSFHSVLYNSPTHRIRCSRPNALSALVAFGLSR